MGNLLGRVLNLTTKRYMAKNLQSFIHHNLESLEDLESLEGLKDLERLSGLDDLDLRVTFYFFISPCHRCYFFGN